MREYAWQFFKFLEILAINGLLLHLDTEFDVILQETSLFSD